MVARVAAFVAAAATMLAMDLTWLGLLAGPFYSSQLGNLKRPEAYAPAAAAFYVFYVAAVVELAVARASSRANAGQRGAVLGLVAYGTYELTNWAVLRDWPGALVPVDILWGVALTAVAATVGHLALRLVSKAAT